MAGKRIAGHERETYPLSEVPCPRHAPTGGWGGKYALCIDDESCDVDLDRPASHGEARHG